MRSAVYVDAENIKRCGGWGMRYDVLRKYAERDGAQLLRANAYIAEDVERRDTDGGYREKIDRYYANLRRLGFKIFRKPVKRYTDEEGNVTTKANADMELAVDCLLQSTSAHRVILVTGDGDFTRLIVALQDRGHTVEVIGFKYVSRDLRDTADFYYCGFMIPGLVAVEGEEAGNLHVGHVGSWVRGSDYGFFRYLVFENGGLVESRVFVHLSAVAEPERVELLSGGSLFGFSVEPNPQFPDRTRAANVRFLQDGILT